MKVYDVAVIGGGAAGLACAVTLTEKNKSVVLIDAGERLGKKLAATGNGQGNISNLDMSAAHYHGSLKGIAERLCANPYKGSELFGCLLSTDDRGRIYPAGKQASALSDILITKLGDKAEIILSKKVVSVSDGFSLKLDDNGVINARYIVLCTGGKAQKQFKTDGFSYSLAESFGHTVTKLYPSIVQLKTETKYIKGLKGIRCDCKVAAKADGQILSEYRGDVIFTDYGVSGNAVFYISSSLADKRGGEISIEFLPDISKREIENNFEKRKAVGKDFLTGSLHNKIGQAVISRAKAEGREVSDVIKNFTLPVLGTLGFDYAQVTRGGIPYGEVTDELESKLKGNLFFAGEILDVDGDCGGYNLQWAFTSGIFVAEGILKRL